jgi:hypothetical protein
MFIVEEDSGTFTGTARRHNGYYAGDFADIPIRTVGDLSAVPRLRSSAHRHEPENVSSVAPPMPTNVAV